NLANNNFNGSIPYSISQITSLKYLNLGHNQFQQGLTESFVQFTDRGPPSDNELTFELVNLSLSSLTPYCEAKGVVLCITCAGSGLYVDSILESQGIIVKVRCLVEKQRWSYACAKQMTDRLIY
ncbi:hypothetical protein S83_038841, partial [Arachis hypogaea]